MPLIAGQVLQDRYQIESLLGQGGMGAVYRGTDLRFDATVAIKENRLITPESQEQFAREAGLLYRLHHPNLPRVIDHFSIPGQGQYLVMDYIQGEDLGQTLARQGPIPLLRALEWIGQVLDALGYLHGQNIIHRDVKPANIKLTPQGQVFLVDFGLAKVYDSLKATTIGARGVTPGYAPPEQYGAGRTDATSDLYSAGATLYALLTGHPPPDALELVTGRERLAPPRELNRDIPAHISAAVVRALQDQPDRRYETATEFRGALAASQATLLGRKPSTERVPLRPRRSIWPWVTLVVLLALAAVAVGVWRLLASDDTAQRASMEAADVGGPATSLAQETSPEIASQVLASVTIEPAAPPTASPALTGTRAAPTALPVSTEAATMAEAQPVVLPAPPDLEDGGKGLIAFKSNRDGSTEIYIVDAAGHELTRVTPLTDTLSIDGALYWSPRGDQIAFVGSENESSGIYVLNVDTGALFRLTEVQNILSNPGTVAWSPDGARLAYESWESGPMIHVISADVSGLTSPQAEPLSSGQDPSWSPDGRLIAFHRVDVDVGFDIYVMKPDGSGEMNLTATLGGLCTSPMWSPDSSRIAFLSGSLSNQDVYVMNADGDGRIRLTSNKAQTGTPVWSPDGTRIAFASDLIFDVEVFLVQADGPGVSRLTYIPGRNVSPSWSPDGRWIAFTSFGEGEGDIWVVGSDGSAVYRLTDNPARDWLPAW